MEPALPIAPRRLHLTRLMTIWRSAGWLCHDAVELDLLAARWVVRSTSDSGHETLRLTDAGMLLLARWRQRNQRSFSAHDRLAERVTRQLMDAGRVVWRELSLRARVEAAEPSSNGCEETTRQALWLTQIKDEPVAPGQPVPGKASWRIARPDVFSVRNTSVEDYLHPMVHEIKVSRADLLSDLRHAAKRESYRWLSCETYYVFPAGIADPDEIPQAFGVWTLNGSIEDGPLELVRPARHAPCKLPFAVWMALAKATPAQAIEDPAQRHLGDDGDGSDHVADARAGDANAA